MSSTLATLIQPGASLSRARAFGHFGFGVGFRPKVTVAFYRPCPEQEGSRYTPTHVRVERESRGQARKRVCGTHPRTHTRTHTHTHTHTRMHAHTHAHGMLGSQHPLPHCKHLRFIFSASITHSVVYTLFQWNHFLGFRAERKCSSGRRLCSSRQCALCPGKASATIRNVA